MNLTRILHAAFFCPGPNGRAGLPLLLWGDPGGSKTAVISKIARGTGLPFHRLSPAERGMGQFGVVPVPMADGLLHYPPPDWSKDLSEGGIIFVDEMSSCMPAIQAPLLGLVQLGVLGSHQFGPRVRTIGAANETVDAAGGWDLAVSLANRFGHLPWPTEPTHESVRDWNAWLLGGRLRAEDAPIDAAAEERRVEAAWPGAIAGASGVVAAFMERNPGALHRKPKKGDPAGSRAWPSRRSWEYAVIASASASVHGLSEAEAEMFMAAFVGEPVMIEFTAWRQNADLPDPADLLDGKVTFEHDSRRIDRTMVVLSTCVALVAPEKAVHRKSRAAACWKLIGEILKEDSDVVVPAGRVLIESKLFGPAVPESRPILAKLDRTLVAAGLSVK